MRWKEKPKTLKMLWKILYQMIKTCCVSCKKNTANENSSVKRTKKKKKLMLVLNCTVCGEQKSRFIQNQELH